MVYGPGQLDLHKLVPYVTVSLLRGGSPQLTGGERGVDWIYVDDVVDAFLRASISPGSEGAQWRSGRPSCYDSRCRVRLCELAGGDAEPTIRGGCGSAARAGPCRRPSGAAGAMGWRPLYVAGRGYRADRGLYRSRLDEIAADLRKVIAQIEQVVELAWPVCNVVPVIFGWSNGGYGGGFCEICEVNDLCVPAMSSRSSPRPRSSRRWTATRPRQMPFMPEMARHAGGATRSRRVDKICDTIAATGSRRMHATVFLDDLRCDGSGHGGCQAGCRFYWKEAWLRRVDHKVSTPPCRMGCCPTSSGRPGWDTDRGRGGATRALALSGDRSIQGFRAAEDFQSFAYWREFTNGNFGPLRFIPLAVRGLVMEVAGPPWRASSAPPRGAGRSPRPGSRWTYTPANWCGCGRRRNRSHARRAGLEPGALLRPRDASVLRPDTPRQGPGRPVHRREDRPDAQNPEGRHHPRGPVCSGECSTGRWFCPRAIYPFWREAWLDRVEEPTSTSTAQIAAGLALDATRVGESRSGTPARTPPSPRNAAGPAWSGAAAASVRSADARARRGRDTGVGGVPNRSPRTGSRRRLNAARSTPTG